MNKTLILVVEDDRPIRNLIVTTLKTHDYKYLVNPLFLYFIMKKGNETCVLCNFYFSNTL